MNSTSKTTKASTKVQLCTMMFLQICLAQYGGFLWQRIYHTH